MSDGRALQSPGSPQITANAINRRRFSRAVNKRLRETTILRHLADNPALLKGKVAIDVGAAVGHISYFLRDYYKEVWAFEAVPHVYEQLKHMEQIGNIHPMNIAVSNFNGTGTIYIDHKRLSNSGFQDLVGGPTVEVRTVKLDSYMQGINNIGFLKVDVEGTEFDVLRGAEGIIDATHPTLMVEIYEPYSYYPLSAIFQFLMDKGYRAGYYSHPELVEVHSVEDGVTAVKEKHGEHDGDFLFWV